MEFVNAGYAQAIKLNLYEHGVLAETSGPNDEVLKLMPPLTIKFEQMEIALDLVAQCVNDQSNFNMRGAA